jgi:L-seryl-tRNA(Ser) seleniumtransferase
MPSIFEKYHLKQVINTSGRMTALGVSTPRPEVVEAVMSGMNHYFEMKDLVNKTGEYIAKLLDVEGATVVSCASAGIAQSVAAVLVKDSTGCWKTCTLRRLRTTKSCCRKATTSTLARRWVRWSRWAAASWWRRATPTNVPLTSWRRRLPRVRRRFCISNLTTACRKACSA